MNAVLSPLQKATLESYWHWVRMVEWAEKQDDGWTLIDMWCNLGEDCYSDDCALCTLTDIDCEQCPLEWVGQCCGLGNSVWKCAVRKDGSTGFAYHGRRLINHLERCLSTFV